MTGQKKIELGSLHPTRDLNYVMVICDGFIAVAKSQQAVGKEINICSGREISIGDLARLLIEKINPEAVIVNDDQRKRPENSEVNRLLGSNNKIHELTDWEQRYTLESGLQETIQWFRDEANIRRYKPEIYNV